ncbi:uncharacterized protein LOC124413798 [Diprion similis]|uniref:uncharacterized protein LOC124413798 n=1 Tax=Diprion similis TaxID=362088 RepID=UPI001EF779FD|nr:uncharacterized protein LOC124413798 [Diprion similis]
MNEKKLTLVTELHKPARRNYPRRRVDVRGIDETRQADLVDMMSYAGQNKGYKYMLTVIDILSKYAWAVPIRSKSGDDVTKAMKSVLTQGRVPKKLHVDRGTEFYNSKFGSLMSCYGIKLYSTYSNLEASILSAYNNTKHRTIRMKPSDVTVANERLFKTGDKVRISKFKNVSEKGYTPNWTTEIFTISQELLKVEHPDIYLVEKVLQKRGKKLYVKWLVFVFIFTS